MGRGNRGLLLRDGVERRGKGMRGRRKGGKETALPMQKIVPALLVFPSLTIH